MSAKAVKFWLDRAGAGEVILRHNPKVKNLEQEVMEQALSLVKAEFLAQFGFSGEFEIQYRPTPYRMAFRLRAADARTGAILKRHPGWLAKFSEEARL